MQYLSRWNLCTRSIPKNIWIISLICLFNNQALTYERQVNLSTYFDSNPRENINNIESTVGLKAKGLIRFEQDTQDARFYGSILGQGFLEPALFLDSKVVVNGELGGYYKIISGYRFYAGLKTFQKLYFDEFQRSGRTTFNASVKRLKSHKMHQELGWKRTEAHIDYGTLFQYSDQRLFLNLTRQITPAFQADVSVQLGQVEYEDYPARMLRGSSLIFSDTQNQRDVTRTLGIHVKHLGKMIWGAAVNFEDINSNSAIAKAKVWSAKLYASGRLSEQVFFHVVLNGMKKYYAQTDVLEITPYRDPEENIQNQLHIQLERVIQPSRVLYIQYSYIKNETVFNHWFYNKNLIETGVKLTL
ncbi:MAG: hypothetical protein H8E26_07035 [FCB group bacterium]|nr:hypothetical protein [FCB group bacterium]MBL7027136.1 hypothetical protein [Candidatus Neomarinimicrobiota bacterium]MBL7120629.1 hypothetical protein [Candidatus Neomarinimicrobiota bacterium]